MKEGTRVKILDNSFGFKKGDIGYVAEKTPELYREFILVSVEGRTSTSTFKPYVAFLTENLKVLNTLKEFLEE